ncbi:MAG: hypothetical protein L6R39_005809 [Caloplaca ligustica]|nr:MAG: hypothetical protein L6R39_005809 [Caloplaca ligustica]
MKGFRLPILERELSLLIPMYGWTIVPESGPMIQTMASRALLIPSESRYGSRAHEEVPHALRLLLLLSLEEVELIDRRVTVKRTAVKRTAVIFETLGGK